MSGFTHLDALTIERQQILILPFVPNHGQTADVECFVTCTLDLPQADFRALEYDCRIGQAHLGGNGALQWIAFVLSDIRETIHVVIVEKTGNDKVSRKVIIVVLDKSLATISVPGFPGESLAQGIIDREIEITI